MLAMYRRAIMLLGFVFCTINAHSQWSMGISAGYDFNVLAYDVQWAEGLQYTGYMGRLIETPIVYRLNERMNFSSGLSVLEKGFEYLRRSP